MLCMTNKIHPLTVSGFAPVTNITRADLHYKIYWINLTLIWLHTIYINNILLRYIVVIYIKLCGEQFHENIAN